MVTPAVNFPQENGRVTKELMAVQQALEQSNNQKAVQEVRQC